MSNYIDSLEWDKAENEVQKKARVIGGLADRLTWLEREITKAGGKLELSEKEEIDNEIFGERPVEPSLYLQRLQRERLRTKDLLIIEQIRKEAQGIEEKRKRLFFLIEKQGAYLYDKEAYETGIMGWMEQFPDWIVESKDGLGIDEKLAKHLLSELGKQKHILIDELENYLHNYVIKNYFKAKDMAAIIDELIKEEQQPDNKDAKQVDISPVNNDITLAAIAILHIYLAKFGGQAITQQNKQVIAAKYGYNADNSGTRLYNEYNKYKQDSQRTLLSTTNKRSAKEHLKRFECILPILKSENDKAFHEAEKDLKELLRLYEKYFDE
jgi:hypothetical protein